MADHFKTIPSEACRSEGISSDLAIYGRPAEPTWREPRSPMSPEASRRMVGRGAPEGGSMWEGGTRRSRWSFSTIPLPIRRYAVVAVRPHGPLKGRDRSRDSPCCTSITGTGGDRQPRGRHPGVRSADLWARIAVKDLMSIRETVAGYCGWRAKAWPHPATHCSRCLRYSTSHVGSSIYEVDALDFIGVGLGCVLPHDQWAALNPRANFVIVFVRTTLAGGLVMGFSAEAVRQTIGKGWIRAGARRRAAR